MARPRKIEEEVVTTVPTVTTEAPVAVSEKEKLLALYDTLNALGIRSISDLENLIARA